jgi:hypothetical protein
MPTLAELKAKVDELQVALDVEQQQVADLLGAKDAAIAALDTIITDLQALVAAGGTEAERHAILDALTLAKSDLEATVAP